MNKLPIRSSRHVSGELGVARLKVALPPTWIMREQPTSDYGVDVEIEVANEYVTGLLFKGQVRAKTPISWRADSTFREPFDSGKLKYWRSIRLPVVLFLVDNESGAVFWSPANTAGTGDSPDGEIVVRKSNKLPETAPALAKYSREFVHAEDTQRMLNRLSTYLRIVKECQQRMDYDCFLPLEPEEYASAQFVYDETMRMRQALGLSNDGLIPWVVWLIRSHRIFEGSGELYNGVFDELMLYLQPRIDETVAAARKRLELQPTTLENYSAKCIFDPQYPGFDLSPGERLPLTFWKELEDDLRRFKALKHSIEKAPKKES